MANQEKLYEAFGELLYVVAMADGMIQEEEISTLENLLAQHPWGRDIKWSFDYERKKERDVEGGYAKVIDFCKFGGEHAEYKNMIDIMQKVAAASNGVDTSEQEKIDSISAALSSKFKQDLHKIYE